MQIYVAANEYRFIDKSLLALRLTHYRFMIVLKSLAAGINCESANRKLNVQRNAPTLKQTSSRFIYRDTLRYIYNVDDSIIWQFFSRFYARRIMKRRAKWEERTAENRRPCLGIFKGNFFQRPND
jgi:hypothetical protein